MAITPSREQFLDLAGRHSVVPVTMEVLADRETPVTAFEKLVGDRPGFLLESVEGGESWARWSFVGWDPVFTLRSHAGVCTVDDPDIGIPDGDPLEVLEALTSRFSSADLPHLPPLHSGAVGLLGYDCVRYVEHLPSMPPDDRGLPEMVWQFVGSLAAIDRFRQTIVLVRNVFVGDDPEDQYDEAIGHLEAAASRLAVGTSYAPRSAPEATTPPTYTSTFERTGFEQAVRVAKRFIAEGDAFQIVVSQRLETEFHGDPFAVYRAIRLVDGVPW